MNSSDSNPRKTIWRIVAAVLALVAFVVAALRFYAFASGQFPEDATVLSFVLGIFFPLSLSMIFGYAAWKGKGPGEFD